MEEMGRLILQAVRTRIGADALPAGFEAVIVEKITGQIFIFPALLGLASLSALGLAWWLFRKIGRGSGEGIGPFREFRFNDQLVWILILGFLALLASSGVVERIGVNAVVFMGGLYALRGVAVVTTITGGISLFGGILLAVVSVVLAPYAVTGAALIGLGDTWFDLRKWRASPPPEA
jgi:hypothetical protein